VRGRVIIALLPPCGIGADMCVCVARPRRLKSFIAMKHVAAYMLCVLGGNASPDAAAVKKVLTAGGVTADDAALDKVITELKGKSINDLVDAGTKKMASIPSGGGGGGGGGAAPAAAAAPAKAAAKAAPPPEEEEDMGFSLFD
jgi:large subunit ribosomal protein LP2